MITEDTKITQISEAELAEITSLGGADNVMLQESTENSPLKRQKNDISADLDLIDTTKKPVDTKLETSLEESLILSEVEDDESTKKNTSIVDNSTLEALEDLVKDGSILLFEGDKPLKDYTKKEQIELIRLNQERVRDEESEKAPAEFFDSLPPELQYAAKYVADGGKDLQGLLKHLSQAKTIESLDVSTEEGQEQVVRRWLSSTELTPEEVNEEVNSLKDLPGALAKKANLYKPKLDAKQQQIIDKELKDQETRKTQQETAAVKYRETLIKALSPGELGGIKITSDVQGMLYNGLTQANYPSVNGRNTNLFGHLIEKYNYVEPNPQLIAEALWLLKDPDAYREAIKASGTKKAMEDTVKKLKSANSEKSVQTTLDNTQTTIVRKTITKPKANLFARS